MPELPEIETIKKGINKLAQGKRFSKVEIRDDKLAKFSQSDFRLKIKGTKLEKTSRRAKMLILETDDKYGFLVHLKMTGQLIFESTSGVKKGGGHPDKSYSGKKLPHKYTKIIFRFDDGSRMYFNDIRRFGWVKIVDLDNLDQVNEMKNIGPEPFGRDFTLNYMRDVFNRRGGSNIKNLLMDQKEIAGVGNIYASESLFLAGIDPRRRAGDISQKEIEKIYQAIKKVLRQAIKLKGTSSDTYVDAQGRKGNYRQQARVYDREGEICRLNDCQGKVKKIKISNRGTYYCPNCQD